MKYWHSKADLQYIYGNLRSKNLAVFPKRRGPVDRVLDRLIDIATRCRMQRMQTHGFKLVVSEQVIENALVLRNLRDNDETILDFGGFESALPLQLSAVGYRVTVWDQRPYPFSHPNLSVLCQDLFAASLEIDKTFDVIIAISTIEHLGLGAYGDKVVDDGDRQGVEILWNLLGGRGRMMVSVPAGKPSIQRGYRVYDESKLVRIFPHATSISWFMKEGREGTWSKVGPGAVANVAYSEPYGHMPVEAIAFVICDKGAQ